jgi:hypothetical protein
MQAPDWLAPEDLAQNRTAGTNWVFAYRFFFFGDHQE